MTNTKYYIIFSILLTLVGIVSFYYIENLWLLIPVWLVRTIGNGVVGHRYFAHEQFKVGKIAKIIFAYYTSICSYSTPFYWKVQHLHHHRNSDKETDIHSPLNGLWNSIILWMFNKEKIDSVFLDRSSKVLSIKTLRDKHITNASKWFIELNVIVYLILSVISLELFFLWAASYILELIKFGAINSILHWDNFLGNYKNHSLNDHSNNNLFLGFITMGFGWHNNHHNDSKKLNLREKWWEIDIEAYIGKLFEKFLIF